MNQLKFKNFLIIIQINQMKFALLLNLLNYQYYLELQSIMLECTNPNASRHITEYKNNKIDCLHIISNKSNGLTVLFCNPNAGYYEYSNEHANCNEVYKMLNINVILWKYCKYGCSTGTLTPNNLIECGVYVTKQFQNKFQIKALGIHGISLGGMIATEIAYKTNLAFLIADRTYSSLGQIYIQLLIQFGLPKLLIILQFQKAQIDNLRCQRLYDSLCSIITNRCCQIILYQLKILYLIIIRQLINSFLNFLDFLCPFFFQQLFFLNFFRSFSELLLKLIILLQQKCQTSFDFLIFD
ncbi:unnamed protein product [Paramecium sonneborni]|uniref:Uncharacterized protein n=1 Tax=Paramecium sonneborni TaxID=65129 RepID=A0A8S1RRB5_9CILI|nr:unnamed protein product [Paramecium sonneborni]